MSKNARVVLIVISFLAKAVSTSALKYLGRGNGCGKGAESSFTIFSALAMVELFQSPLL